MKVKACYQRIRTWSNANQGVIALLALVIATIGILPLQHLDISFANSFLNIVITVLAYDIRIPVYLLTIILVTPFLFALYIRRKFGTYSMNIDYLAGKWRNQWGTPSNGGVEDVTITKDGKYLVDGKHIFHVREFQFDKDKNEVRFVKIGVAINDVRKLLNVLKVVNNELLEGMEGEIPIKYTRLLQ